MTQQYALYVNEDTVKYPPKTYKSADKSFICFNFDKSSPEILASQGYLPLVEDEQTECEENKYFCPHYELCSETIQEENEEGYFVDVNREYIAVHWTLEELTEEEE